MIFCSCKKPVASENGMQMACKANNRFLDPMIHTALPAYYKHLESSYITKGLSVVDGGKQLRQPIRTAL